MERAGSGATPGGPSKLRPPGRSPPRGPRRSRSVPAAERWYVGRSKLSVSGTAMIRGLDIDASTEARVWSAFESWGNGFVGSFAELGVPFLIDSYDALVRSIETETCPHGPDGATLQGDDWRFCCGVSYEYLNDISVRDAVELLCSVVPEEGTVALREAIAAIDLRLRRFYPASATGPYWWREALPVNVLP